MYKNACRLSMCAIVASLMMAQAAPSQNVEPPLETVESAIAVDYAKACLELAETELLRAQSLNRRVPNVVPKVRLDWLKRNVEFAKEQVRLAQSYVSDMSNPIQLAFCAAAAKDAQQRYRMAAQARKQNPNAISALELESLRLKAKTTKLRLRMWQERSYVSSAFDQMQWQINRLTEQIVELNDRLAALESGR